MKLLPVFIILALLNGFIFSQNSDDLLENDIDLPRQTLIQETIDALLKNPININTADYDDLIKIPYLTPIIVNRIIETRKNKTKFNSISNLLQISGIDAELLDKIRFFITVTQPAKTSGQFRIKIKLDTLTNFNNLKDYELTSRTDFISINPDLKFRAVIITDKDKKEDNLTDFLSSSIAITGKNNKLVLGNFLLNMGLQLLFTSPYSYSSTIKNFTTTTLKSISELTGVYENKPLFGITYSQTINQLTLYGFLSQRLLDAEIKDNTVKKVYYYTKYTDSLSRSRRNQLRENLIGTRLIYLLNQSCLIGTTVYHSNYDKPFAPSDLSNSFYGNSLYVSGIDMQTHINNYFLKSELAYSISNGFGFTGQIIGDWQYLKVNFNFYAQQKNFFSPYSRWKTLTNRKDNLSSAFNIFYNLSDFKMYLLLSTKQDFVQESLPARIQYRLERKQDKFNLAIVLKSTYKETELKTYGTRFDLAYQITENIILNTRIEDRYLKNAPKSGHLVACGIKYHNNYFRWESRIYYFNVSSADCKIYAYEPIRNSFGFASQGMRLFSCLEYKLKNILNLNCYLGYTKSSNTNLDSGLQISINI